MEFFNTRTHYNLALPNKNPLGHWSWLRPNDHDKARVRLWKRAIVQSLSGYPSYNALNCLVFPLSRFRLIFICSYSSLQILFCLLLRSSIIISHLLNCIEKQIDSFPWSNYSNYTNFYTVFYILISKLKTFTWTNVEKTQNAWSICFF